MTYIKSILIGVIFMFCPSIQAQTSLNLDSLLTVSQNYKKEDTTKLKMLIEIAETCAVKKSEKGLTQSDKAIELAQKLNIPLFLGKAYSAKGNNAMSQKKNKEAVTLFENALNIFETLGNQLEGGNTLANLGRAYYYLSDIPKSIEYFEKSVNIFEKLGYKSKLTSSLSNIGVNYIKMANYDKALIYIEKGLNLYEQLNEKSNIAYAYANIGIIYSNKGDNIKALEYYQKSLDLSISLQNQPLTVSQNLNNIGNVYQNIGDYARALEYHQRALKINEEQDNKKGIAVNYTCIAETYRKISDFSRSLDYFQKALALEQKGNKINEAFYLGEIGSVYVLIQNYPKALEYFNKALAINEKRSKMDETALNFYYLGTVFTRTFDYTKALEYYQKALVISQEIGKKSIIVKCLLSIGNTYRDAPDNVLFKENIDTKERFKKALELQQKSLNIIQEIGLLSEIDDVWREMSLTYEKMGDYSNAYNTYQKHIVFRDSIAGEAVKKQITRKEIQYEFDKKEAVLKFEKQLTAEQLEKQKLLSLQQQQTLSLKEQALIISNKEKDLQHLAFLKEKAEKQEKEQALSLAEKDKLIQSSQLATLIQEKAYQVQALAKKNALIGFLVSSLVAVILGLIAFLLWFRQKQAKREAAIQALFSQQLIKNIEEERRRIAFDLHDSISHELLTLKRSIHKDIEPSKVGAKIDDIIDDIRKISRNLHPVLLEKIGLKLSIDTLCEQYGEHENLFVSHEIEYNKQLPCTSELQVFRIIQEVLTNTAKYAHANASYIGLKQIHNALKLEIRDNGKGFDVEKTLNGSKAFGLHSILQRSKVIGGNARIDSSNLGTTIQIVIPI